MAHPLKSASGADQPPAHRATGLLPDDRRLARDSPIHDLELARVSRANLLVVGDDEVIAPIVTEMWPSLATPVLLRFRGQHLRLPRPSRQVGTIVVYDVDTLTPREQRALHLLIRFANGRAQVVATASKPLQPMLEAGEFDAALYYRLNVVTLDLTSSVTS